jgi:hypothetical protein
VILSTWPKCFKTVIRLIAVIITLLIVIMLIVIMLMVAILTVLCRVLVCSLSLCYVLQLSMLSIIMLSDILKIVVMLSIMAPTVKHRIIFWLSILQTMNVKLNGILKCSNDAISCRANPHSFFCLSF